MVTRADEIRTVRALAPCTQHGKTGAQEPGSLLPRDNVGARNGAACGLESQCQERLAGKGEDWARVPFSLVLCCSSTPAAIAFSDCPNGVRRSRSIAFCRDGLSFLPFFSC